VGLVAVRKHPGVETPGYCRVVPLGRMKAVKKGGVPTKAPAFAANIEPENVDNAKSGI
jgi:hypothetical protein